MWFGQDLIIIPWSLFLQIHVRGHQGVEGNEAADQLARDGAAKYKPGWNNPYWKYVADMFLGFYDLYFCMLQTC